mmetsp:Transcript_112666/g.177273  ORF Transcript_112666/g.177273 Transcript_112666/m.177273 type:complete len:205 (-) Transcript_112666:1319-1933(-)
MGHNTSWKATISRKKAQRSTPSLLPSQSSECKPSCLAMSRAAAVLKQDASRTPRQPYSHLQVEVYCPGANHAAYSLWTSPPPVRKFAFESAVLTWDLQSSAFESTTSRSSLTVLHWKTSAGRRTISCCESPVCALRARRRERTAKESTPAKLVFARTGPLPKCFSKSCNIRLLAAVAATAGGPVATSMPSVLCRQPSSTKLASL